jgi:hypothetical protein
VTESTARRMHLTEEWEELVFGYRQVFTKRQFADSVEENEIVLRRLS